MHASHVLELLPTSWTLDLGFILINQLIKGVVSQHPTDSFSEEGWFSQDESNVGFWFMLPRFFLSGFCFCFCFLFCSFVLKYLFIWLFWVLVEACRILHHAAWIL